MIDLKRSLPDKVRREFLADKRALLNAIKQLTMTMMKMRRIICSKSYETSAANLKELGLSLRQLGLSPRQLGLSPRKMGWTLKAFGIKSTKRKKKVDDWLNDDDD